MKRNVLFLALAACGFCVMASYAEAAVPAAPANPCPVSYSSLSMPYKHQGGKSTPTVNLAFTNTTRKKIVLAKFGLIVLNSDGSQAPYDQGLSFTAGADPGKISTGIWELDMGRVDINRVGEIVYLKSARFEDNTSWQDDGNLRCQQEVNYAAK